MYGSFVSSNACLPRSCQRVESSPKLGLAVPPGGPHHEVDIVGLFVGQRRVGIGRDPGVEGLEHAAQAREPAAVGDGRREVLPERHRDQVDDLRALDRHLRLAARGPPVFEILQRQQRVFVQGILLHIAEMVAQPDDVPLDRGDRVVVDVEHVLGRELAPSPATLLQSPGAVGVAQAAGGDAQGEGVERGDRPVVGADEPALLGFITCGSSSCGRCPASRWRCPSRRGPPGRRAAMGRADGRPRTS